MKTSMIKTSFALLATSLFATSAFAADLNINVIELGSAAQVTVTDHGHVVKNAPVTITNGAVKYVAHTNDAGSLIVANHNDVQKTYTFTVDTQDGSQVQATRLLGK